MHLGALLAVATLRSGQSLSQTVHLNLVPMGVDRHMGGYRNRPILLSSKRPAGLVRLPRGVTQPLFGQIALGGVRFFVVLGKLGKTDRLFVDANANGDLSDDRAVDWRPKRGAADASGLATVTLPFKGRRLPCTIFVAQIGPRRLTTLLDYAFAGRIKLGTRDVSFLLVDEAGRGFSRGVAGGVLGLDREANGRMSGRGEVFGAALPFTVNGASYVLHSVDLAQGVATFMPGARTAEIPINSPLALKETLEPFDARTLDGKPVRFPADYAGRAVLLYAWATWSKSSMDWLPAATRAYREGHERGLSVLGVCLDRATDGDAAKAAAHQMPWPTVSDGKSWAGPLSKHLRLQTLPYLLLVDGSSGKVLATMNEMAGADFDATINGVLAGHR